MEKTEFENYSDRQLIKEARSSKKDLERNDLYTLIEVLADRLEELQNVVDRF